MNSYHLSNPLEEVSAQSTLQKMSCQDKINKVSYQLVPDGRTTTEEHENAGQRGYSVGAAQRNDAVTFTGRKARHLVWLAVRNSGVSPRKREHGGEIRLINVGPVARGSRGSGGR